MDTLDELAKLVKRATEMEGIEAVVIASPDGVLITGEMPDSVSSESFAAMCATMLGAAGEAANEAKKGIIKQVIAETKFGKIIAIEAGEKAILAMTAKPTVSLRVLADAAENAAREIKEILE